MVVAPPPALVVVAVVVVFVVVAPDGPVDVVLLDRGDDIVVAVVVAAVGVAEPVVVDDVSQRFETKMPDSSHKQTDRPPPRPAQFKSNRHCERTDPVGHGCAA